MESNEEKSFGESVRAAREARGWGQERLAAAVGTTQSTIDRIERGEVQRSRFAVEVAAELGIPLPRRGKLPSPTITEGPSDHIRQIINSPEVFARATGIGGDVPVYAAAEGGPGEMIVEKNPIDQAPRPEPLQGVKEGYLVYISGESMVPEYRPGQRAIVHPKLPATPGETHIFYTNDPADDRATIKHLVRITADAWHVEQWNPPKQFTLDRKEWPVCHRVVGKYTRQ